MPLKWERIYVGQLYDADAHLDVNYNRAVRAAQFRKGLRKWTRRAIFLLSLWTLASVIVPDPNEWLLLFQVPDKVGEVLWLRIVEQQIPITVAFQALFSQYLPWWIALGVAYMLSFFNRPPVSPNGSHRRITNRIQYLCKDGIMLRTGQLVQWSGLKVVFDKTEIFEIRLQNPNNYQVLLHVNCTLEQYIPLYLFVKKCLPSS